MTKTVPLSRELFGDIGEVGKAQILVDFVANPDQEPLVVPIAQVNANHAKEIKHRQEVEEARRRLAAAENDIAAGRREEVNMTGTTPHPETRQTTASQPSSGRGWVATLITWLIILGAIAFVVFWFRGDRSWEQFFYQPFSRIFNEESGDPIGTATPAAEAECIQVIGADRMCPIYLW